MTAAQNKELQAIRNGLESLQRFTPSVPPITVQPATDEQIIETDCKLVAYFLEQGNQEEADKARERLEQWVLRKAAAARLEYFDGPMDDGSRSDKWLWTES